jgi:SAM-dependent methyltransferase
MRQEYIGTELELFENAHNWKQYWFDIIKPYIGNSILDVGAGIGSTAKLFSRMPLDCYIAVEPDMENVKAMQEKASLNHFNTSFKCINGGIDVLSDDDLFDTILYIDVLEHIQDDKNELQNASKHLLPGGRIIILSPAHQWLFSPFDESVGHFKRYNKNSLMLAKPDRLITDRLCYLDSIGIMASASNRLFLRSSNPSEEQINFWDNFMVPVSKYTDKLTRFLFGKTILGVFQLPMNSARN